MKYRREIEERNEREKREKIKKEILLLYLLELNSKPNLPCK